MLRLNRSYKENEPPEVFYKEPVLKSLAVFTEKHLCLIFFSTKMRDFIKEGLPHMCFPANIAKCFKNTYFENICERLLLYKEIYIIWQKFDKLLLPCHP